MGAGRRRPAPGAGRGALTTLLTVGHGTQAADDFAALLTGAGVELLVDVRIAPGSRRHPQFGRDRLAAWLPEAGVDYRWEKDLGGRRRPRADSRHVALREEAFRGYADHMEGEAFRAALRRVLEEGDGRRTAVMCAESVWWRCHRRLLADAAVARGAEVLHLFAGGRLDAHRLTEGARTEGGAVVYDVVEAPGRPGI